MGGGRDRGYGPNGEREGPGVPGLYRGPAGLDETIRACRRRDATTEGVPTFLLLEDPARSGGGERPDSEGAVLGELAKGVLARLSGAVGRPSDRDVAFALEVLAARCFAPEHGSRGAAPGRCGGEGSGVAAAFSAGRYIRAVNFHATPRRLAGRLEGYLSWLAERFAPVTDDDLLRLVAGDGWPHDKPGLIVSFYNGFRDNFKVAAPILDRVGIVGRFFVVAGWVLAPSSEQRDFALRHRILLPEEGDLPADGRLALSPGEVAALAERGHVIASHTATHVAPAPELPAGALDLETAGSRRELGRLAGGRGVRALAWHEGSPLGLDARADEALRSAGYELLFANHAVQRVR